MFVIQNHIIINLKSVEYSQVRDLVFQVQGIVFDDADKFVLRANGISNYLYAFTNDGGLRFKNVDYGKLSNGENHISIEIIRNEDEYICSELLTVIHHAEDCVTLPEVTVTSDKLLKDVTAINTAGQIVTGNISNSVITETDQSVSISKGYIDQDKYFQKGSSDVQGFIFNNVPRKATSLQVTDPSITAQITDFSSACSNYRELNSIPFFNTDSGTNFDSMFYYCLKLKNVPLINTSNGTDFGSMFSDTAIQAIPLLDTSNGTDFGSMFKNCKYLDTIPLLNTSKGTSLSAMFCLSNITHIPQLDTQNATSFYQLFYGCKNLHTVPALRAEKVTNINSMFYDCKSLTNFGGLIGITKSWSLQWCTNLTHQSLLNVLNNLGDLTGKTMQTLTLGTENLAKLSSSEKNIATQKNWALA